MYLCELLLEFHGVSERPLMSPDFSSRCPHKDCSDFIDNKQFSDIVWVCPHDSELLRSSLPVKLGNWLRIADSHDIKDTIKYSSDAFASFVPNLKYFITIACHHGCATIPKDTLQEHILLQKVKFLDHVPRRHLHCVYNSIFVWVYQDQLVQWASNQSMPVPWVTDALAVL